jgi:hypothetical protein
MLDRVMLCGVSMYAGQAFEEFIAEAKLDVDFYLEAQVVMLGKEAVPSSSLLV